LVIAPSLAQIAAKKLPPPLPPSAAPMGKIIKASEPIASINKSNTVQY
jgi:hypothetical protein